MSVDCDSTAARASILSNNSATSPLQDKDPHSSTGEMAYEVVLQSQPKDLQLNL